MTVFATYPDDERYLVTSDGAIFGPTSELSWRPVTQPGVYPHVEISGKTVSVHKVVTAAFLGKRPPGTEIAHWDGDPNNVHLTNLRYATPNENAADRIRHGTQAVGDKINTAKLTSTDVQVIRKN